MVCDHPPEELRVKVVDTGFHNAEGFVNEALEGLDVESHEFREDRLWIWYRIIPEGNKK